ncbi:MAG: hypothetical protein ACON5N_19295, partial [Akkermansiaceae bacterium]
GERGGLLERLIAFSTTCFLENRPPVINWLGLRKDDLDAPTASGVPQRPLFVNAVHSGTEPKIAFSNSAF